MIVKECAFNPVVDCAAVEQFGFIDLVDSYANGVVPSNLEGSEEDYNGMEDPGSILGKPSDIFEAYKMREYIDSKSAEVSKEKDSANG